MKQILSATELSPWKLYVVILVIVFLSEFSVMLMLPLLSLESAPGWAVGMVDAALLTLLLVPLFGWIIIRPLQHIVRIRADLLQQFIILQEEERERTARDLHDEIGQSFTSVLIGLRTIDIATRTDLLRARLNQLADMVSSTLEEVRRLARGLRPAVLDHLGLTRAIEQHLDDFQAAHGIEVEFLAPDLTIEHRLSSDVETAVFRIVQESLTNTARHAGASHVRVSMRVETQRLFVEIADNGQGFSSRRMRAMSSTGLLGMTQRAAVLKGTLEINSRQGSGTRVRLAFPLTERRPL